jgi:hypothetical protein
MGKQLSGDIGQMELTDFHLQCEYRNTRQALAFWVALCSGGAQRDIDKA